VIYFIQNGELNHVKIGYSANLYTTHKRIVDLQVGSSNVLTFLGIIEGHMQKEKKLHKKFNFFRQVGEWFMGAPDLMRYIDNEKPISTELKKLSLRDKCFKCNARRMQYFTSIILGSGMILNLCLCSWCIKLPFDDIIY